MTKRQKCIQEQHTTRLLESLEFPLDEANLAFLLEVHLSRLVHVLLSLTVCRKVHLRCGQTLNQNLSIDTRQSCQHMWQISSPSPRWVAFRHQGTDCTSSTGEEPRAANSLSLSFLFKVVFVFTTPEFLGTCKGHLWILTWKRFTTY